MTYKLLFEMYTYMERDAVIEHAIELALLNIFPSNLFQSPNYFIHQYVQLTTVYWSTNLNCENSVCD